MDVLGSEIATKPLALIGSVAALSILYFVGQAIYILFIHPLHKIPGPWINAVSRIPLVRHMFAGTMAQNVSQLHAKYGEVVRLSPNEVSFISGETAWQDIYGFRIGKQKGQPNMRKDPAWYAPAPTGTHIIVADDKDHSRFRKTLSHAFSDRALSQQEGLIQRYVDLLVARLKEVTSTQSGPQDMTKWYNWTTFDVIADLLFGEPFGSLQDGVTHKYIALLFKSLGAFRVAYALFYWPFLKRFRGLFIDLTLLKDRAEYFAWVRQKVNNRIGRDTQRPDFMTEILKHNGEKDAALTEVEIANNAAVLITAGSETTATLLSVVTFCLLKNPQVMQKLKDEVRGRWNTYDEITLDEVNKAPYLLAVLQEALRYMPPVPAGFERQVGKGGSVVSGYYMPEGTALSVSSLPLARSERNFSAPDEFIPERWMGETRFKDDKRDAHQPFSYGPRVCLGKSLAYAEMRLILAKVIWSFDFELDAKSANWEEECRVKVLWDKPALDVFVKEVVRG